MKKTTRYVFSAALAGVALSGVSGFVQKANAAAITAAAFTFETDNTIFPSSGTGSATSGTFFLYASVTAASVGPLAADSGVNSASASAYGVHTYAYSATGAGSSNNSASKTVWSTPVGNGSSRALSANHWGTGDYYEFDVSTAGLQNILVSFDQTSSATGPHAFSLIYSVGGTTATAGTYSVGATSFSAGSSTTAVSFGFDLSTVTALNDATGVVFRLSENDVLASTSTATGGTDRLDNFVVSGGAVPEPAGLSVLTIAGAAALMRRRKPE